jgi:hypothetical protein
MQLVHHCEQLAMREPDQQAKDELMLAAQLWSEVAEIAARLATISTPAP